MQKISPGYNPAAWILEVTCSAEEHRLGVDFAEVYRNSDLFQFVDFPCEFSAVDFYFT